MGKGQTIAQPPLAAPGALLQVAVVETCWFSKPVSFDMECVRPVESTR